MDDEPVYLLITSADSLDGHLLWPTVHTAFNHTGLDSSVVHLPNGWLVSVPASPALLHDLPTALTKILSPLDLDLRIVIDAGGPTSEIVSDLIDRLTSHPVLGRAVDEEYRPTLTQQFVDTVHPPLDGYEPLFHADHPGWGRRSRKLTSSPILSVAVMPHGREVVTGHSDGFVRSWRTATGTQAGLVVGPTAEVTAVGITPDARYVVAGDRAGVLHRWSRNTRDRKFEIPGTSIRAIAVTPDGRHVLAGTADGNLAIWDPEANALVREFLVSSTGATYALAISRDGTQVVTGGESGRIRRWRLPSGEEIDSNPGNGRSVRALAFAADGSMLVSGGGDGTVRVWGLPELHLVRAIETTYRVRTVAVHGSQIVFGGSGDLQRLSINTGEPVGGPMIGHDADVFAVAVTPDGQQIVSGGADGVLRRWDAHTGAPLAGLVRSVEQLAEVVSDLESAEDRLNIGADVHTVAAVLAALSTKPPLSVALLGDWGAGKSSFMRQLRDRMELLAQTGGDVFAGNIRQVTFNAWHYSDDHLWVGIVEHLFRSLRSEPTGDTLGLQAKLDSDEAERDQLERELHAAERHTLFGMLGSWAVLRAGWHELRRGGWRLWVSLAAVVAGVAVVVLGLPWIGGIVAVLGPVLAGISGLGSYVEAARSQLTARKAVLDQDIKAISEKLDRLDPARRLDRLLDEITDEDRYAGFRGLTGRIHHDLRRLSDDLAAARSQVGPPPLQRIVLYVDDLDRCTPERVVDVLQAVNLLLTMDLFMVVVAVDPRWLLRSLESHHRDTFAEAGPVTYLDKIFHIPFALRPMGDHAVGYLHSLLPPEPELEPEQPLRQQPIRAEQPVRSVEPALVVPDATPAPARPPRDTTEGLRMTGPEREFLSRLTPLLTTPRAIKKLANLYRLVRLSVPRDQLTPFLDGDYQAAALLLAALAGDPSRTRALLIDIAAADDDLLKALRGNDLGRRLADLLDADPTIHRALPSYQRWAREVARYGFETYDLYTTT